MSGEHAIHHIVLTGGPCSGKSTAMAYLAEKLGDRGFRVLVVPEVATLLAGGGVDIAHAARHDRALYEAIETEMIVLQGQLRERYTRIARAVGEPTVILYDRAEGDCLAYMGRDAFMDTLADLRLTLHDTVHSYDAVLHLVTAAIGAREHYTLENNAARRETADEAAAVDETLRDAWLGHPHLRVIDNSTGFEGKLERTLAEILSVLGVPVPVERERKFLLADAPDMTAGALARHERVDITQTYLLSDLGEERVRRRSHRGHATFFHTVKTDLPDGDRAEHERIISPGEYRLLLRRADPTRRTINKTRHCLLYGNRYLELDAFHDDHEGLWMLEVEVLDRGEDLDLPAELQIAREVTDDRAYRNAQLALTSA